jgi:hypothetical protein
VVSATDTYSGADVSLVCKEAAMGALRSGIMSMQERGVEIGDLRKEDLPPLHWEDFRLALDAVKPSVAAAELEHYVSWNRQFGSEPTPRQLDAFMRRYGNGGQAAAGVSGAAVPGAPPIAPSSAAAAPGIAGGAGGAADGRGW